MPSSPLPSIQLILKQAVPGRSSASARSRRQGIAFVYVALIMLLLLGMTGLVIDIGHLHTREAMAMRAADAAALAGAMQLAEDSSNPEAANTVAREYATLNGYDPEQSGVVFKGSIDPNNPSWYTVFVAKPEPLFFVRVLPGIGAVRSVGASATAAYLTEAKIDLKLGGGIYGATGPVMLSVFGPHAEYQHGDPYSPRWLDAAGTPNPDNIGHKGYDFELFVPADYATRNQDTSDRPSVVDVELFDPDTYNTTGSSPNGTSEWDEIRPPLGGAGRQPVSVNTQTRYTLYKVNNPNDPSKDQQLGQVTYRDDPATNNKWVLPPSFSFDTATYGTGAYRINVETLDGSSENGFELRAGPPPRVEGAFNKDNGTKISAIGKIPINFNTSGMTTIALGEVPAEAGGGDLVIEKFDTDIESKSVTYTSIPPASNEPPGGWPGQLSENAQWLKDAPIRLPGDYQTAQWYATYEAGWQDTSVWKMSYAASSSNSSYSVKLVGRSGKAY